MSSVLGPSYQGLTQQEKLALSSNYHEVLGTYSNRIRTDSIPNYPAPSRNWTSKPQPLDGFTWWKFSLRVFDILLLFLPLLFVLLGVFAIKVSGRPTSDNFGQTILRITLLGPTIWPIMFAAIAGRMTSMIALYRAERGATLGTLEQLVASRTLFSTIEMQFLFGRISFLGIGLILLWCLSPVGGQAALRLLDTEQHMSYSSSNLTYLGSNSTSIFEGLDGWQTAGFAAIALFSAAIVAPLPLQQAPVDAYSNVKIPVMESLGSPDKYGWRTVDQSNVSYSSLLGIPVVGMSQPPAANMNFSIESSYFSFDCPEFYATTDTNSIIPKFDELGNPSKKTNTSSLLNNYDESCFLYGAMPNEPNRDYNPNPSPRNILFGSISDSGPTKFTVANCSVVQSRVESEVLCKQGNCAVNRMRRSLFDTRSPASTPLEINSLRANMFLSFPNSLKPTHIATSTPIDRFIFDPSTPLNVTIRLVDLSLLPKALFLVRFSLIFNTWYHASVSPLAYPGNSYEENIQTEWNATIAAVSSPLPTTFIVNRIWLTVLFVCSIVLFATALASSVAKLCSHSPDILGFVSSLTRDSPYIPLAPGGTTLDGGDRARELRNLAVRIEDVAPRMRVGHIALTISSNAGGGSSLEEANLRRLKKGRLYA
ncbi:MAG: hypothetical protein M1829_003752 [Trizodia sp. TS-e1964]|nr:MAG: hypothetical protein M1829_003752 [Trizodia sp. TS-e1964]